MKKIVLFVSLIITASIFFACDKQKTAQEMLKEEKKAIERFTKNDSIPIFVTNDKKNMYKENTYYKTKEGLYIHVIDSGNGNKPQNNQEILVRYRDFMFIKSGKTEYDISEENESAKYLPISFYYKNSFSYKSAACYGLAIALDLVSENAEVSLIVPSDLQLSDFQSLYKPMYFGYVKFRFK